MPFLSVLSKTEPYSKMISTTDQKIRYGAKPVKTHRAGQVPGPTRRGPPTATGGPRPPIRWTRDRGSREKATGPSPIRPRRLNVMQWNAEGVQQKKKDLAKWLDDENIDIASIKETHLNPPNKFWIEGYQAFSLELKATKVVY